MKLSIKHLIVVPALFITASSYAAQDAVSADKQVVSSTLDKPLVVEEKIKDEAAALKKDIHAEGKNAVVIVGADKTASEVAIVGAKDTVDNVAPVTAKDIKEKKMIKNKMEHHKDKMEHHKDKMEHKANKAKEKIEEKIESKIEEKVE